MLYFFLAFINTFFVYYFFFIFFFEFVLLCFLFFLFMFILFNLIKKIFLAFRNVSVRTSFSNNDKRRTKVCWAPARVFGKTWTTDDEPQQLSTTHRKNSQQNPPNTARKKTKQNQTEQHSPLRHALKHTQTYINIYKLVRTIKFAHMLSRPLSLSLLGKLKRRKKV